MKNKICYIIGAGKNYGLDFIKQDKDFIIAADGGLNHLKKIKIKPDLVIGDFDSVIKTPKDLNIIKLKVDKDDTDTFAAITKGLDLGYQKFVIYCGTGFRFDHTIANIQTLAFLANQNKQGFIIDKSVIITAIKNNKIEFPKIKNGYISVFSFSDKSEGVFLKGLKFELNNATLFNTIPRGVSNEFINKKSFISVDNGTLIIIYPRDVKVI
ncbi:MAG: thiamine diphosphokinase [Malacoplasma sp.]|nr:thiamine diphosphokinase [Malacoplasma sp.]